MRGVCREKNVGLKCVGKRTGEGINDMLMASNHIVSRRVSLTNLQKEKIPMNTLFLFGYCVGKEYHSRFC